MQNAINFNNVAIVSIKESDCRIKFWYMSKDDTINIMNNSNLNEKNGLLQILFSLYIKLSETTFYQKNRDVILDRAKKYYENNTKVLKDKARDKYRDLSDEEKNIKREYGRNRYHNMSEEKTKTKRISKKL